MFQTTAKLGKDLQEGDVIVFLGKARTITHFEPHPRPEYRVAHSGNWSITVADDDIIPAPLDALKR